MKSLALPVFVGGGGQTGGGGRRLRNGMKSVKDV